ncbi:hypothetical protein TRP66_03095 [Pseudomonas sp. JDS28PS106]|uniref:hypothetical protein n=1 Tax=Pseudomonas sp. JDS28PS106 TaxID=2497235 RepID=UPI002FCF397A
MPTAHRNHQARAWNIQHMHESIDRLLAAAPTWKPADAIRGEKTIKQLERQIAEARSEPVAA